MDDSPELTRDNRYVLVDSATSPRARSRGIVIAVLAILVAVILLAHGLVPNVGGWASLLETFLPWLGVAIALLGVAALIRWSRLAGICVLASALVWVILFGPAIMPHPSDSPASLTVASENIHADSSAAGNIARGIAGHNPDVIAFQELGSSADAAISAVLGSRYPHRVIVGTIGIWSKSPIVDSQGLTLGLGWRRAVRVDVDTPTGKTRIYAIHLASVRPGEYTQRNEMLASLDKTIKADDSDRLVVVGDFNSSSTDRSFARLTDDAHDVTTTDFGLGFTWPAEFPVARLDHALVRGLSTVSSTVLPDNGSDHRGIIVGLR